MQSIIFTRLIAAAVLTGSAALAVADEHASIKRAFELPPAADLHYRLDARQKGFSLSGAATVNWRHGDGKYSVTSSARAQLLGKILDSRSEGSIDAFGLAPAQFREKRFRKAETTARFDRAGKTLSFNDPAERYKLTGGEQDRASIQWQLAAVARGAPEKFIPGSEWKFFVAGRRDAQVWSFKVVKRESIKTGMGTLQAVHVVKAPPADSKEQRVDLWLAPGLEWYPVKLRFSDEDGEMVEQTLEKIVRK
ncbi:DUF3108 domain-containing protein [Massilia sp. PAMC28688]|uniref:DUF3108 domain-containing protein n=1 Tax=Massilia sp. PAMC28688 TaxID=2861283 RepID=UPI001C63A2C9|nr:DUF3108 domain-containing protein [Massilia sp. PAMC28688]QYF94697.1 DUF3108 domain-containing protein [Massilia sp. PAMC28688]